jgi:hypothetical protein
LPPGTPSPAALSLDAKNPPRVESNELICYYAMPDGYNAFVYFQALGARTCAVVSNARPIGSIRLGCALIDRRPTRDCAGAVSANPEKREQPKQQRRRFQLSGRMKRRVSAFQP